MRLLPSEQRKMEKEAIELFKDKERITLVEPCDCGSRIQHNDGGNYHQIIEIAKDDGRYFIMFDDTCEFTEASEWEEITREEVTETIRDKAKDGYRFE